jgi:hypothetical protein
MRKIPFWAMFLLMVGTGGLLLGDCSYSDTEPTLDSGSTHVIIKEEHRDSIAGIVVFVAGIGLTIVGRQAA